MSSTTFYRAAGALVCARRVVLLAGTLFLLATGATASASTIAGWTFETSQPAASSASIGPVSPEVGAGLATGSHISTATVWSSPAGNGSAHSFSSNTWATGDYLQFQVSTTGMQHILVSWDQTSSNTGPRDFQFEYSTNGVSFTNVGSAYSVLANAAPNPVWNSATSSALYTMSLDLSAISGLNNAASAYFRLVMADTVSANGGTVATAGTDRVDNFSVVGSAVPEPQTAILGLIGFIRLALTALRRRNSNRAAGN
jgi:hypothetical protein